MSVKIQQLVELIETLTLLKSTSEEAANVFEKVIQSKANAHEGGLAGYLKEITADAKIASKVINELENEIKVVSSLSVKSSADESPVSGGVRSTPVVSDAARRRKEVQDKLDEERRARVQEIRGDNRPEVVKRHTDRSINFELLLAQLDQQIDEREDTLRDMVRRTQAKMRTPVRNPRPSSPVPDPEYADMKWALTTPDTRSATSYAVTPNRGGRVSVAQSGGARPPENASVSAIVKYVNTQLRHENPAETRPEIAPIVAELQKLVKDREEATVPADKNRINQQIKQAFKKINQSSGTVSNTQRQTAQESIIAPIIEALRAVKLDDPTLNAAMSPVASSSEIESALTRAVEMLVTRLENGAAGRVGETALSTEGFEFLRPAAFDQLLKRLKTVVAEATTRPVIPRSRTVDPGTAEEVDSSALFLGTDFSIQNAGEDGSPQVVDALRSSRVFPGQVTRIGANISKYIQSLKASLNPTRRYSSEAQGVDVRAGSQVVAGSSSAVFGGGMDAEVQKAVDALFSTVMQDIEEGNIRPASIAGQTVDLPESLAKMVVEAIQSSSILSEHTTAFGRMAGTRGPRGAIVTGDPVRKFVALFAGDLINQYTSTGAVSDQSASRFVEQTVAPEQEQEVTLAATHAKRLRERLVYQRDQADLSMVTAAPAMANRYRTESAKLGKEIQLLDEILAESENPEEEKKLAQRRGQIALPGSNTAPALTRDQALTVLFKQSIGSIPATPDAVAPIMSKAQEVSAGLAQSGLTIPARPSYGTSPVQSLVEYMTSGQSMALDRYQTTPITQQLDSAGTVSSGQQNREFIEIISDAFGLSRQSASAGNVITGMYYGARATDASGKMLEGEELDQSLGGGYRTKKGLQSIVQASAEMGSYGSGGIPLIEYAKLATSTDLDAEEQSLFQEVQAKLPHLQAIDSDSLKQLAELDTSMDPKELIKRVLTLAAPAIKNQIVASIRRRGGAAGMGVDEVTQMISDYETAGVAPAGFQDEFRALAMFDPANINTTDVSAAVNRSLSLFSNLLTDNVQSGEGMPQFAARVLGRQDRLVGTGPDVAAAVPDQGASYSLMGKGAEVANQESGQVVGGTYGRNVENQIKIQEAMSEFEQLTAEIEEMQRRIALAPHEADKVLPVIEQKNNQLKILKQKLDTYKASEPDPISQKFEALSTIAQMDNIDPATRSAAIYDLGIMQEIFNQTGRYQIDESQGYGTGTQEQRLTNLMAHKAKLDRLQKLREERAALEAESPGDGPAKAVEAVIKESDVDGEIAAVTKDISDMKSEGTGSEKKVDASPYANMNMTELEDLYQRSYQKYDRAMSAVPGIEEATQRYHNYEGEDDEQELEILVKALEGARENNPEVAKLYQEHQAVSDEYERRIKANIENNRAIQEKLSPAETSVMATSVPGTIDEEIAIDENAVPSVSIVSETPVSDDHLKRLAVEKYQEWSASLRKTPGYAEALQKYQENPDSDEAYRNYQAIRKEAEKNPETEKAFQAYTEAENALKSRASTADFSVERYLAAPSDYRMTLGTPTSETMDDYADLSDEELEDRELEDRHNLAVAVEYLPAVEEAAKKYIDAPKDDNDEERKAYEKIWEESKLNDPSVQGLRQKADRSARELERRRGSIDSSISVDEQIARVQSEIAAETVKVSAEIKASPEEIQKREAEIDAQVAIDENAVPLQIPRIKLTESKDITDDVTAEDKSVFVHPATVEAQLIESPAFTAFLAGKENQIISGNQDRLAIRQDAETGALTAAVADGASSSWFSARLANMLAEEAVNLPTDEPFTTESILSRVNNRSAQEQVDKILEYFTDEDYQTRYQLQRMGLEKNDKSKEKFKKFLQPFEEAGTSPTVRELIAFLHGEKAANDPANIGQVAGATFAGYRRTRSSEGYKHEFLTAGDALIESADLGIAKETLGENKTNPDGTPYTGPQTAGIISTESGIAHPGKVLTIESKTPARVFLASDAYSHSGEFSRLDPEVDAGGFVNLGERLLLDEGELGTRQDDRSFIGITGSEQTGPVVKTGGLAEEGFTGLEFTDQLEAYLAQEKRKLSQINQLLTDRPDIDKELERERQALLKSAEAEVEQQGQLAEEITNTHRAIADEYDAVVDRLMKNRYAGPEEKAQDSEKHRKLAQTPEMQEVLKARREAFKAEQKYKQIVAENPPTSAEKAKVVTENNIQALTEELTKRGVILPTETTPTAETVIPVTDVTSVAEEPKRIADEPVKVSAEIKASPEEIEKRKADVDAKIAEAEQAVAQSQQVIELMQRQAQGLDTEDSDIRFVVDNTGIPVSYEDKQVIDRTSLRPLVRTKMTVDDTGESGFVSNLNVRDIVDQAEAVKPTAELMDEIGKMSDADLAAVKMPSKVLTDEEKEKYQYLRQASKQAKEEARKIYEADTPLGEAIRKYYRITNVEERDRMTLGDIGSPAIPGLKEAVAEYELQRGISLGSDEQTGKLGKASEATPLQLAARLFRSSRAAVRAYETEFGVEPAFSARDVMDELLASSARAEVDSAPAGSAETSAALAKTISSFEAGLPPIAGPTDRKTRRGRRAPIAVVDEVEKPYTENQLKYARAQVKALAGRTDLTAEQKRQLSEARKKLHNYAMKRLTTNFGDNKGVMQIANVVAGLTPPDWAKDDVQSARVSAISQAMADLKPGQLAKLKDVDLRDPVQMDILSKDPALQPIMALLADQDIDAALKYRSGTTEYDEAKGLLSAIEGAKKRLPVPEPTAGVPTDARRLFFDLETNFAKKPEDRLIFQAATGVNDGKVSDMYAVPLDSSAEEINRIAVDPTIPDDEKRKLIRELALKRAGKPPLVEGRASGNDVSSGVIDNLVNAAMSGRQILTQGQIRGDLQSQILAATTVAGHNIETFDLPTVYGGEMAVPDAVKAKTEDTLLMSRNMYPGSHTLSDTYEVVTGDPLVNAHDARADTEAVQRIFPQVSDPEERAKITEAYLAKHGITMDSAVGQLVATPKIADIADTEERKKASRQVAEAHAFYQPLADMQDFTRRIAKSGGKTILRDADKTVAAEQGWYDMSPAAKASLFERMNKMFVGHTKLKGKKIEELDDAELGEFVKEINATYLEPNADAAVGGDFGGMKRLLEEKVGGKMAFSDFRTPAERLAAIKGRTIEDVMSTAGSSGVKVGPAISKETVGDAIEDISLATERPTKVKTPGSAPSVTASTSDGGSKEPPREPPVTFSDDADSGERGGPGGGITTIASATIDTLHAGAVEINIHGGNVTIDANFSAGAAEKMQKSLVYISNKDGMNVNGDVTSVGTGGGGGGYRRVSVADRSILNQLDAAKNQIAGQLQTETDPATRERLRGNLNEVSRQAIRAIIEPKVKAIDSEGMEPYVNERFYYGDETTDSKESLTYYNDAVAQAHQDLTTQLEAQQAIPEGTDGRDEEIQRIQKQISLVEELINALTELNQAEQRVGSATSTRAIVDPTEVKKPAYPTNNSGYRKLSPEDRASLAVLDATKNSISEQLRTEQDPEARARLKETLTGASKKAIADIIKPKATKLLGYGFVNTVDALSTSPEDSLVNYSQAAQSKLSELNGRLFMIESEREDAPGREEAIERTKREIQQVHELIDALTELNQAEQRVGAAGATRNAESPYGPKPTADPRAGANKYRKVSFADQASFNVLESTKNEVSARLRDETDSAARDALRQSLVNASERAINEVIKPKAAKVLNPTQLAALSALPMGPEEALVSYNEMAQYNLNNLSTELATQEALPEGTSGRDTEIERLKAEIAAVEELINALTELNAIEQRVGSASGTRNVNSPYGTTSGTGTGTSASKYYSRKAKEDEQVFLQLARNSFDQSAGTMGVAGSTTNDSRRFLTDLTRSTATTMINSSGIQAPGMAADIAAIAATSPEVQATYDEASESLKDFSGKIGGTIADVADDLFTVVSGLEKLKAALTPLAATSPEAAAALQVVQTAIDETSGAGKEQRSSAGVIEADNRKKLLAVEEQMQAAASRPGFFAGGRRTREVRELAEGYLQDTFGQKGREMLMNRGRIQAYTTSGKRIDMDRATVADQRETVKRLQAQGVNVTAEDMTNIARLSGRVTQTQRSAPMGDKLFYAASKIRDSQTVIQTVLDTVASIPNIPQMLGSTLQQFAGSATGSNRIATTARGLALNPENYAQALKAADEQRKQFGGSLTSNLGQVSSFIPLSNAYGVDIGQTVKVARKLASFDPAQGMEGASIAIKEFLSGNVSSLSRRFEINRSALSKINTGEATEMLDSLDDVLSSMGVTDRLIDEQANSMATKYDKMVGNLESLQISLSTGMVNLITPTLEGLIGEQSYFGKNVKERSLNTILKETITSYGDEVLSDPKTGLESVNIGGNLTTFTSEMDTILAGANRRMAGEAGRYNSATGGSVSVPGYRLLGNMKPEERASIQFDALIGQAQGMGATQALMQAMRNNPGDYNSGPEFMNQRESVKTKDVVVDQAAYAKAYKEAEAGLLLADKGGFTMDNLGYMNLGGGSAVPNFNAKPKKDTPLRTKGKIRRQIDADTYEVEVPGQEGLLTVRTGGIDAQEKGTRAELASRIGGADILGMDRAMVGGEYAPGQGPDITLLGSLKNIDENNRVVAQMLNKEGKNYSLEMIAKGDASVAFTEGMDQKTIDNLRYIEKVVADNGVGSQNSTTRDLRLGGVPEVSQEVRDAYFQNKYLMGIGAATAGGGVAGYGTLMGMGALAGQGTSFAALTGGTLGVGLLGAGAMVAGGAAAIGGGYYLGARMADRMDSSPEKMRELYRMQAELNLEQAKLRTFEDFAAQANQEIGPGENYVGGAAYRTGSTTNDKFRRDGRTGAEARDQVIRESTAAMGKVYVDFYDEAVKAGQERYATADDSTKRILERRIIDPITGNEMSYLDYEAQTIALKKTADQDPASYGTFSRRREELLAPIDQTGALIQNQKLVDDGIKYGTRLNKRDLAEAKAVPLREDIRDLTRKRDDAFEGGALAEGKKYQEQIDKATAKVEEITYTDAEWDAIPESARYLIMSAEEVANMTAAEIRFAADAIRKEMQNPTDYKREARNFWDGTMDRNFQRRQQRVDTTLTAFARQSIMGLGEQTASNLTGVNEDKSSGNMNLVMDNGPEARAVRMAQRSGLMPRNIAGQEDTVAMLTEAQKAAVAEQLDIGRTNRQIALANAPEMQLLKSGFTNFAMYMNMAGATAEDLGRSFMNTMNMMSEGNPRYGLDLAQQMTGFSYEAMIGMQLRPRTGVDAEGNPISSLNGANGMPYGYNAKPGEIVSGPMVMPYTSGPRGTIAYSRDMMAVNSQGVRENALGIAPSQWQQFVSNATNANAELQRRAMSNAMQERDLNKNHQRNLEDIARNGMRQLESIHLNYTRNMQQLTMQADLVKGTTRANAARSIAMAAIDPTRKQQISSQYWAQDRYFQHIGQGDSVNFLKDSSNIAAITAIDPSLSADISALETTNAAYENSAITDPNRQDLQNAKRATIEPILTKLRGLIETETDPIKRAALQKAIVQLSPDASRTIAGQNENDKWLKQNLGDAITETQLGQQISDQEFQNQFRPLDIANDAASGAEAARSQDPLALLNWRRSSETMYRGFGQADKALNDTKNSLAGLTGTAHMFEETSQTAIGQIAAGIGSATQSVLYSVDDFETSFQQQMEDALRNFERQRLDMIQAFADAAVEIASIVPEEMIPIMQATSAFMNTQRQAELLWLSGRTDEANALAYQGMLKLGEVVYGEGKGKEYADKYSQNFQDMADVAARDVPQGDLGKFAVKTEDGWALLVKETKSARVYDRPPPNKDKETLNQGNGPFVAPGGKG